MDTVTVTRGTLERQVPSHTVDHWTRLGWTVADSPPRSAPKPVWVDHAVAHGADREQAEQQTKSDLIDTYGS